MTHTIRFLCMIGLAIFLVWCVVNTAQNKFYPKYERCGKVIAKGDKEQIHKYNTRTEFILAVQFDDGSEDVSVSLGTWSKYSVGDRMCFISSGTTTMDAIAGLITIILCAALAVVGLIYIVILLYWIFTGEAYFNWNNW